MGLGSAGNCGFHWLAYEKRANSTQWNDFSHGSTCDFFLMLKVVAGLYNFWCLMLLDLNCCHGPQEDQYRFMQIRDAMTWLYDHSHPHEQPLFQMWAPDMIEQLTEIGVHFDTDGDVQQQLWDYLREREKWVKTDRRIDFVRFHASSRGAAKACPFWAVEAWEVTWVTVELDMVKGDALISKLKLRMSIKEGPNEGDVPMKGVVNTEDNSLVVKMTVRNGRHNRRLVKVMS